MLSIVSLLLAFTTADFIEIDRSNDGLTYELFLIESSNPLGIPFFSKNACCVVHKGCYSNLLSAGLDAKSRGYSLKIVDTLRPLYIQEALFASLPDKKFFSEPGSEDDLHSRGLSIDVLLTNEKGQVVALPTPYLETTFRAFCDYRDCSEEERYNRELLADIMTRNGFKRHPTRWWEFQSTYWDSLNVVDKKEFSPFNHNLEEIFCKKSVK